MTAGVSAAIRRAVAADTGAVASVVDAAYRGYIPRIGKKPGPMLDDYGARIAAGQVWVLEADGDIVGILVLEEVEDGLLLDNIAVTPERHGLGLGRALSMFAEQEAGRRGWPEIRLYTHARMVENISLYKRIGYVETGRRTEKGFDRVYMAKAVTKALRTPILVPPGICPKMPWVMLSVPRRHSDFLTSFSRSRSFPTPSCKKTA